MAEFGKSTPNKNKEQISNDGPQLLEAALRAHQIGDITNAETLYLNAINSGFHHEIVFSNLGVIYQNTGRKEKALAIYKRAIAKNPNFVDAYTNLGYLYKVLGNLDQALAITLKSLELNPDDPNALMNLGGIHKDLGNLDQALTAYRQAATLEPKKLEYAASSRLFFSDLHQDNHAINIEREAYKYGIRELKQSASTLEKSNTSISTGMFWLAYHNRDDDKEILQSLEKFSALYKKYLFQRISMHTRA